MPLHVDEVLHEASASVKAARGSCGKVFAVGLASPKPLGNS